MKQLLVFLLFTSSLYAQVDGVWHCAFTVAGTTNRLDIRVESSDTTLFASDPDSAFVDVQMQKVRIDGDKLSFEWSDYGLSFHGKLEDGILKGVMKQGDVRWTAVFYREEQAEIALTRPQEPKEPFGFTEDSVIIESGDVPLGATLMLPHTYRSDLPIVVLVSGTGPQDRNEELMGHKPFLVIADYLARHGIATLRFDDRGVGESGGNYATSDLNDFANDVSACVDYLDADPRFAKNKIGVAGHSEGGMHALIAASKNKRIDFIIELASVGTSGRDVLVEQQYLMPIASGESEEVAAWNRDVYAGMCSIVLELDQQSAQDTLNSFLMAEYDKAPASIREETPKLRFVIARASFINNDWARQFLAFQGADYLKKLKIPILALNGEKDIQVPPKSNSEAFENNFSKKSKMRGSKAVIIPNVNHLFQHCESCDVLEYGDIEETFSEDALQIVTDWIHFVNHN